MTQTKTQGRTIEIQRQRAGLVVDALDAYAAELLRDSRSRAHAGLAYAEYRASRRDRARDAKQQADDIRRDLRAGTVR